jgi:hypothetical protein
VPERRRSLTPLESELRADVDPASERKPRLVSRLPRPRKRRPPTTLRGAVARGLLRLAITLAIASGIALLIDHLTGRDTSFGFYIVGAAILAIAFFTSASDMSTGYWYKQREREQRINWSFAYMLAGALVIAVGVLIDLL